MHLKHATTSSTISFPLDPSPSDDYGDDEVLVECAGASTTSAGSWSLGTIRARHLPLVSNWLTEILNSKSLDPQKKAKPRARYLLVHLPRGDPGRSLNVYGGPDQKPFSEDVSLQRDGLASPFKFQRVDIIEADKIAFQDVCPINVLSMQSFRNLQERMMSR